jgi:cytochrome P450
MADDNTADLTPRGPKGWPVFGSFRAMAKDPIRFVLRVSVKYPAVARYRLLQSEIWQVSDPDLIGEVLQSEQLRRGQPWTAPEPIQQPTIPADQGEIYVQAIAGRAKSLATELRAGETRSWSGAMSDLTLGVLSDTAFADGATAESASRAGQLLDSMQDDYRTLTRTWKRLLPESKQPERARLIAARQELDAMDEAVRTLVVGQRATSVTLTWAFYELSRHRGALGECLQEVDAVVGDRDPGFEDLTALPKLQAVARETLRLYPPAWLVGLEAVEALTIGRFAVPQGANVVVSPFAIHQIPRFYEEPEEFIPSRWHDGLMERLPRFAYMPYGAEYRTEAGRDFAETALILTMATVLKQLWLVEAPGQFVDLDPSLMLGPVEPIRLATHLRHIV